MSSQPKRQQSQMAVAMALKGELEHVTEREVISPQTPRRIVSSGVICQRANTENNYRCV